MPAPVTAEQFFKLPDPEEGGKLEAITVYRAEGGLTTHLGESVLTAEDAGFGDGQFAFPVEEVFAS